MFREMNISLAGLAVAAVALPLAMGSSADASVIYETSFEQAEGYNAGSIDSQQGWTGANAADVVIGGQGGIPSAPDGDQMLQLDRPSGQSNATAEIDFTNTPLTSGSISWVSQLTSVNDTGNLGHVRLRELGSSGGEGAWVTWFYRESDSSLRIRYRGGDWDFVDAAPGQAATSEGHALVSQDEFYKFDVDFDIDAGTFDLRVLDINDTLLGSATSDFRGSPENISHALFQTSGFNTIYVDGFTVIPEPGSLALLGLGGLAMLRRQRRA